jgi:ribonuclease HI
MSKRPLSSRGASLFADSALGAKPSTAAYRANVDGASRGNPGPAAYGVLIRDPGGNVVAKLKKYIGRATNNTAEYYALIAALDYAHSHGIRALRVESDSDLLVQQMRGRYKVKSTDLRPLYERARKMTQGLETFRIDHVYREQNPEADALANAALDDTAPAPPNPTAPYPGSTPPASSSAGAQAAKAQGRTVRARYQNGALHPLTPLDLPEGAEVVVWMRSVQPPKAPKR